MRCRDPCCRFLPEMPQFFPLFTKEEYESLVAKGIGKNNFYAEDEKHFTIVFKETEGVWNLCPFVKDKMLCSIYENIPLYCKMWPFALVKKDKKDNGIWLAIDNREFCLPVKRLKGTKEFEKHVNYLIDYFQTEKIKGLIKEYPKLVSEEHPDFKFIKRLFP